MKLAVHAVTGFSAAWLLAACQQPTPAVVSAPVTPVVVKQPVRKPAPQPQAKPAADKPVAKPAAAEAVKPAQWAMMPLEEFLPLQQEGKALIYDARPSFVRAFGHIPGSIGWPRSAFKSDWAQHEPEIKSALAMNKPVVIYCTDLECPDAKIVAGEIAERGYPVKVLTGGYGGWKEAGLPVE